MHRDLAENITNQEVFVTFHEEEGLPDGITLDADGHLWAALWDGSCILRLSEDGAIAEKHLLPVCKVASLTFGGYDLSDLYVSTGEAMTGYPRNLRPERSTASKAAPVASLKTFHA